MFGFQTMDMSRPLPGPLMWGEGEGRKPLTIDNYFFVAGNFLAMNRARRDFCREAVR